MSKIGKQHIKISEGVTVQITDNKVVVSGPKGQLQQRIQPGIEVKITDGQVAISRKSEDKKTKALHGLVRSLIANMIEGVTNGFFKVLEIKGTGYRANMEGDELKIKVGFSHPVIVKPPVGIKFEVKGNNIIKILGIDRQLVGQVAASIRDIHKPEPYKGKGIRYKDEVVRKKQGKVVKAGFGGT